MNSDGLERDFWKVIGKLNFSMWVAKPQKMSFWVAFILCGCLKEKFTLHMFTKHLKIAEQVFCCVLEHLPNFK